jgi:glucosamine 6-phosphate synthetase-like amidotransferase/phosphosugar isomerase protein
MLSRNALLVIVTDCKDKIVERYQVKQKPVQSNCNESQETMSSGSEKELEREFTILEVPKLKNFSCLLTLVPMQILVERIAELKGINPDMPRNLAKTVTV